MHDGREKVVASMEFVHEVVSGANGRVDRPLQRPLRPTQREGEVGQAHGADQHQVNVTGGLLFSARDGAIDKSKVNGVPVRLKRVPKNICQTGSFRQ